MDFSGSGEIISFGKPILASNNQLLGAVMIDSAVLTNKKRIGPYFNSEFFDGRFKSYMIIIDIEKDLVISHPERITEERITEDDKTHPERITEDDKRINSYFTTSEERKMIQGFVKKYFGYQLRHLFYYSCVIFWILKSKRLFSVET